MLAAYNSPPCVCMCMCAGVDGPREIKQKEAQRGKKILKKAPLHKGKQNKKGRRSSNSHCLHFTSHLVWDPGYHSPSIVGQRFKSTRKRRAKKERFKRLRERERERVRAEMYEKRKQKREGKIEIIILRYIERGRKKKKASNHHKASGQERARQSQGSKSSAQHPRSQPLCTNTHTHTHTLSLSLFIPLLSNNSHLCHQHYPNGIPHILNSNACHIHMIIYIYTSLPFSLISHSAHLLSLQNRFSYSPSGHRFVHIIFNYPAGPVPSERGRGKGGKQ